MTPPTTTPIDDLLEDFERSEALAHLTDEERFATVQSAAHFLDWLTEDEDDASLDQPTTWYAFEDFLLEYVAPSVRADFDMLARLPRHLARLARFLAEKDLLGDPARVTRQLDRLAPLYREILSDERTWRPAKHLFMTLSEAGYDVHDERSLSLGQLAFDISLLLRERLRHALVHEVDGTRKRSRNAPCPCGSGRKFKKCCLGNGARLREHLGELDARRAPAPVPLPRLCGGEGMHDDLALLGGIIASDEILAQHLFPRSEVVAFIEERLDDPAELESPDARERVDDIASEYTRSHTDPEQLDRLQDALVEAVGRVFQSWSWEGLGALGLGVLLATTHDEAANPLNELMGILLFRVTFSLAFESDSPASALGRALAALMGPEGAENLSALAPEEVTRRFEALRADDPTGYQGLFEFAEDVIDAMEAALSDGVIPIPLPLPTVIPALSKIGGGVDLAAESDSEELSADLIAAISEAADEWTAEDVSLYRRYVNEWSAQAELAQGASAVLEALAVAPPLLVQVLLGALLRYSVARKMASIHEPELTLVDLADDDLWQAERLEAYGDRLEREGYPGLANRVRELLADRGQVGPRRVSTADRVGPEANERDLGWERRV